MQALLVGCKHLESTPGPVLALDDAVVPYTVRCGSDHYLPNLDDWLPGDVFLFKSVTKARANSVSQLQAMARLGAHSEWTHVGIYDGYGRVWDAMPGSNIRNRSIQDVFTEEGGIRLRRPPAMAASRAQLLTELTQLGTAIYDPWAFQARYLARLTRLGRVAAWEAAMWAFAPEEYERVICSTFVSLALRRFRRIEALDRTPLPLPADFLDPTFSDVPLKVHRVDFT